MFFGKGKRKIIADYKSADIYNHYKDKVGGKALPKEVFWRVWKEFVEARMKMVIYDNLEFYLPYRLGSLRVRVGQKALRIDKNGNLKYAIDYGASVKLWKEMYPDLTIEEIKKIPNKKKVYFTNEHTDGKILYWYWDKITCNFKNKSAYKIELIREWKRMLAHRVKKVKKIDYYG